jgi:DNA (cytosine-5)-methyltransferase 1
MSLYQEIIVLQNWFKGKFLVENVIPYYTPLIPPTAKLHRHIYWSNFPINYFKVTNNRKHQEINNNSIVYGFNLKRYNSKNKAQILKNMVDPELGQHILNTAQGIITKQNIEQTELEF